MQYVIEIMMVIKSVKPDIGPVQASIIAENRIYLILILSTVDMKQHAFYVQLTKLMLNALHYI